MDLAALIRHTVATHHSCLREQQPILQGWLATLAEHHGARHPELHQVREEFETLANGLLQHIQKEEHILFPYIEALWNAYQTGQPSPASPFGTILNPIRMMEQEHRDAGDLVAELRLLTDGFHAPDDACTTYRACYAALARFEADLQRHVHFENDLLFPRAIALETKLS